MVVSAQRDIDRAFAAAQCVVRVHERLVEFLRAGQTLAEIDAFVAETLADLDCKSAFLRYRIPSHPPFPSHSCLSRNECIVHGTHTMTDEPIAPGDLLSVDIGVKHQGFIGDAAWTYGIEAVTDEMQRLMTCGRAALAAGIAAMQAGRPLIDWARAVQTCVEEEYGFSLVRGLGGHGYGHTLHGAPFVSNVLPRHAGEWPDAFTTFKPGMLIAVEPMIAIGGPEIFSEHKQWPIFTEDRSLSVHYESDVLITEEGPRDLTEGMDQLPDLVGNV
ncbi:MAG: type I methionyl aminopeptidase [Phycisphaerales bacterium]|nr:type I methionyl aminopeptidase [Phycisphaerales bacterium]NNM26048.1 type I methionyl aminopeptidase [Phycisphaerales bacterium]